jgi:hypothetical protein
VNFKKKAFSLLGLAITVAAISSWAYAKDKTFTGTIGDALCGREHSMSGSSLECIRECRGKGSNFSLITEEKVYNLQTEDKAILDTLEKQEDLRVTVSGTLDGDKIAVTSVKPAR